MRTMKDSGVEWIGKIPSDWEVIRLKLSFISRDGGAWGDEKQENAEDRICLRIADFDYSRLGFKKKCEFTIRNYDKNTIDRLTLKKGDILIEKSGGGEKTPVGRSVIFDDDFPALYANFMDRLRCSEFVFSKWMLYLLSIFYANGYVWNYIKQTTGIQNLDLSAMLGKEVVPLPPLKTQQRIADFLDKKCGKIDEIIEREQAVIEKLKEYKQSVITEAVTKGLKPNATMKDSGIDFLGLVPNNWDVMKFGYCSTIKSNLVPPDNYYDYPQISPDSIEKNSARIISEKTVREAGVISWNHLFHKGQIIYSKIRPMLNKVTIAPYDGLCSADMYPIDTDNNTNFIVYLMLSNYFTSQVGLVTENRVKMPKINQSELSAIMVALPPLEEQAQIANYLDNKCVKIDTAIEAKQAVIDKLTEYKKSLIYEVVTGKKEVKT